MGAASWAQRGMERRDGAECRWQELERREAELAAAAAARAAEQEQLRAQQAPYHKARTEVRKDLWAQEVFMGCSVEEYLLGKTALSYCWPLPPSAVQMNKLGVEYKNCGVLVQVLQCTCADGVQEMRCACAKVAVCLCFGVLVQMEFKSKQESRKQALEAAAAEERARAARLDKLRELVAPCVEVRKARMAP
eukprot:scaffold172691_cov18-Tisochrysis_lutea.AAC.1